MYEYLYRRSRRLLRFPPPNRDSSVSDPEFVIKVGPAFLQSHVCVYDFNKLAGMRGHDFFPNDASASRAPPSRVCQPLYPLKLKIWGEGVGGWGYTPLHHRHWADFQQTGRPWNGLVAALKEWLGVVGTRAYLIIPPSLLFFFQRPR